MAEPTVILQLSFTLFEYTDGLSYEKLCSLIDILDLADDTNATMSKSHRKLLDDWKARTNIKKLMVDYTEASASMYEAQDIMSYPISKRWEH